jgi:hypothetical protein
MRKRIGIAGVFGFGISVTVALGQGPRGAVLLPPQPADPQEAPVVARAAGEPLLPLQSTPVNPSAARNTGAPAWINGTDPNIRPASGIVPNPAAGRGGSTREDPSLVARSFDRLKATFATDAAKGTNPPQPGAAPPQGREQVNAQTAFRSTSPTGQPVYAGPPAYRWYGWGSVTPGANPYAPTGHYPKASANWYAITGATPGAFPVTVAEPARGVTGTEPPGYGGTPPAPQGGGAYTQLPQPVTVAPPVHRPPAVVTVATPEPPRIGVRPAAPVREPVAAAIPPGPAAPVAVPTISSPPLPVAPAAVGTPEPAHRTAVAGPLPAIPLLPSPAEAGTPTPALPPLPALPPVTTPGGGSLPVAAAPPTVTPSSLPVSVTDDQPKWHPRGDSPAQPTQPAGGEWNRAGAPQSRSEGNWRRDTVRTPAVARGQLADTEPDPVSATIRKTCEGRASGLDIRWTGTKKLTVSFECRTAAESRQLVKAISDRPELAPLRIDFHIKVK